MFMVNSFVTAPRQQIPKIIWQTAKSTPHDSALPLIKTWKTNNPRYQYVFMDDVQCDQFIYDNFTPEFYKMYSSLPIGVMKADVWRVAVVYVYGGVYADIDCKCNVPVEYWTDGLSLVVAEETDRGELANFAFAASPRHPALLSVLNRFMELSTRADFMDTQCPTPVQSFGQYGFSDGIRIYVDTCTPAQLDSIRIYTKKEQRFTNGHLASSYISHYVASQNWQQYDSWRACEILMKQTKPVKFITTFSESGYDLYGKTWIDTFLQNVGGDVTADVYVDFPIPAAPNVNVIDYRHAVPNHQQWIEQFESAFTGTPYNKCMGVRFSYKAFVMMHALAHNRDCYVVWLDGDCVYKPYHSFVDVVNVLDGKAIAVQRERNGGNDHCESGVVIMDPDHPDIIPFLSRFMSNYEIENIAKMEQPFDGFVIYRSLADMEYVDLNDVYGKNGIQGDRNMTFLHPEIQKRFLHNIGPGGKATYDTWSEHASTDKVFMLISHFVEPPVRNIGDSRSRLLDLRKNIT